MHLCSSPEPEAEKRGGGEISGSGDESHQEREKAPHHFLDRHLRVHGCEVP